MIPGCSPLTETELPDPCNHSSPTVLGQGSINDALKEGKELLTHQPTQRIQKNPPKIPLGSVVCNHFESETRTGKESPAD